MDWPLLIKWVHVLSSTILFGTGIGIAYFMWMTLRGGDMQLIAKVAALVVKADWTFTLTAGIIQPLTGGCLVYLQGYSLQDRWLKETLGLYVLALMCWLPVVVLQIKMRNLAIRAAETGIPTPPKFRLYMWTWFALGWPAFISLIYIFYLMLEKPV